MARDPTPEPEKIRHFKKSLENCYKKQAELENRRENAKPARSRGSQAIGANVNVENIRNSSHREHYLGHSVIAPVGRAERRRDPLFWMRNRPSVEDREALAKEIKEVQVKDKMAMNEKLGRPVMEGVDDIINPKPPAPPAPVVAPAPKPERKHRHHHRRHHSRSPRRHHHRSHRSHRERSRSRDRRHRDADRSRSPDRRHRHRDSERRHRSRSREHHRRHRDDERERSPDRSYRRHDNERDRHDSRPRESHYRNRNDERGYRNEERNFSRRGSSSSYQRSRDNERERELSRRGSSASF
ncbi:hypothetical protein SLS58_006858 [Diplodia intermedia]|uniref:Multiple myeloma tumor-associated protein 2-like N-terminal domain-containing protein n=1 Tax=Diplodia intermedia TaxID=856260 RepID=A0ABR3TML1_9PEZI